LLYNPKKDIDYYIKIKQENPMKYKSNVKIKKISSKIVRLRLIKKYLIKELE
jgi:hypothetical protein